MFAMIAAAQARAGFIEKTFAIMEKVDNADRYLALIAIAEAHVENGDIRKAGEILAIALETTEEISNRYSRIWMLDAIAEAQAKAGDIEGAFATATSIRNARDRAGAFARIAVAAVEAN